jgi:hypothetical protein
MNRYNTKPTRQEYTELKKHPELTWKKYLEFKQWEIDLFLFSAILAQVTSALSADSNENRK